MEENGQGDSSEQNQSVARSSCSVTTGRLCHPCWAEFHSRYDLMTARISHSFSNRSCITAPALSSMLRLGGGEWRTGLLFHSFSD